MQDLCSSPLSHSLQYSCPAYQSVQLGVTSTLINYPLVITKHLMHSMQQLVNWAIVETNKCILNKISIVSDQMITTAQL